LININILSKIVIDAPAIIAYNSFILTDSQRKGRL